MINNIPKKNFVLKIANASKTLLSFNAKIWVTTKVPAINIARNAIEKLFVAVVIIKNQNENPAVTANALNLGDDSSILYRINQCH